MAKNCVDNLSEEVKRVYAKRPSRATSPWRPVGYEPAIAVPAHHVGVRSFQSTLSLSLAMGDGLRSARQRAMVGHGRWSATWRPPTDHDRPWALAR
jgi:hypothetical protein